MTENQVLIKTPEEAIETIKSNMPTSGYQMLRESLDMAITALKEVQQYREIGTVDEIKTVYAENKRWHTAYINKKIKNPFANTSTLICQNCDHKDEYIQELEAEIEKYRSDARCYKNAIEIVEKGGIE